MTTRLTLTHCDGRRLDSQDFLLAPVGHAWGWVLDAIAAEFGPGEAHCAEPAEDDADQRDIVTLDGKPVARIETHVLGHDGAPLVPSAVVDSFNSVDSMQRVG